jgi:SAM-dependent methyltransferase
MAEFDKYADEYSKLLHDPIRERFAPGSDFFFVRKWDVLKEHMAANGMRPEVSSWLDVGCGRGDLMRLGAAAFQKVVGCDVSVEMMAACEGLDVSLQPTPLTLPYADMSFDVITAVCVYHHVAVEDRPALTAEVVRVLKPGGMVCIIEHNPFNPVTQLIVRRTPVDADAKLLRAGVTSGLLRGAGLSQLHTAYFLYFPEGIYKKLRSVESALISVPGGGQYATFARRGKQGTSGG